jgi:uncharacterized protein
MHDLDKRQLILATFGIAALGTIGHASAQTPTASNEIGRNKEILAEAYRRWDETKGGSVSHWMSIVAEDITFGSLAEGSSAATFTAALKGRNQLNRYFDGMLSSWSMLHYTVGFMIAEGDRVAVICSTAWRNKATTKVFDTPKVDVWRFRESRAIEFYEYYDTAKLAAAAA